jgi:hypothetical protein
MKESLATFRKAVNESADLQEKIKGGTDLVELGKENGHDFSAEAGRNSGLRRTSGFRRGTHWVRVGGGFGRVGTAKRERHIREGLRLVNEILTIRREGVTEFELEAVAGGSVDGNESNIGPKAYWGKERRYQRPTKNFRMMMMVNSPSSRWTRFRAAEDVTEEDPTGQINGVNSGAGV